MKRDGMTMIEIILAVAVLGAIAIIALGKFYDWSSKAEENKEKYIIGSVQEGIDLQKANDVISE